MTTQFIALEKGDVSIAVPVLGLKVIFVALLTPLLSGESVGFGLWIAAILSVAGVAILNRSDARARRGRALLRPSPQVAAPRYALRYSICWYKNGDRFGVQGACSRAFSG